MDTSFDEIRQIIKDLAVSQAKGEKETEKLKQAQLKTDAQLAATDKQIAATDKQIAATEKQIAATDRQLAATDKQLKKTDAKLKRIGDLLGDMGDTNGELAEEVFYNALKEKLTLGDIQFDEIFRNLRPQGDGGPEFDIILVNGESIGLLEIKRKAHVKNIEGLISTKIAQFRKHYPMYQGYQIYFGVGSLITYKALIDTSREQGIFLLTQKSDCIELVNSQVVAY